MNQECFPIVCAWWGERLRDQDRRKEFESKLLAKLEAGDVKDRYGDEGRLQVDYEPQGALRDICVEMGIDDEIAPLGSARTWNRVFGCGKIWMLIETDSVTVSDGYRGEPVVIWQDN